MSWLYDARKTYPDWYGCEGTRIVMVEAFVPRHSAMSVQMTAPDS